MIQWDLIGFGALNWDLIYELHDLNLLNNLHISLKSGEEIHLKEDRLLPLLDFLNIHGRKKGESGGGQAANTAYALSRMGFLTRIVGKTGQDKWGDLIISGLCDVDTSFVRREGKSGVCVSMLTPSRQRSMIAFPGVNNTLKIDDFDLSVFSDSRFLHLTSFASPGPLQAQIEIIKGLKKKPLICFDPGNLYASLGYDALLPILKNTYCLFITQYELEMMTGLPYQKAEKELLDLGVCIIVCKKGSKGAYVLDKKRCLYFPPLDVDVKDVTGAGDCFAAGFLAGILKGFDLNICGEIGTKAAAACIRGYGRKTYPDKNILCYEGD